MTIRNSDQSSGSLSNVYTSNLRLLWTRSKAPTTFFLKMFNRIRSAYDSTVTGLRSAKKRVSDTAKAAQDRYSAARKHVSKTAKAAQDRYNSARKRISDTVEGVQKRVNSTRKRVSETAKAAQDRYNSARKRISDTVEGVQKRVSSAKNYFADIRKMKKQIAMIMKHLGLDEKKMKKIKNEFAAGHRRRSKRHSKKKHKKHSKKGRYRRRSTRRH